MTSTPIISTVACTETLTATRWWTFYRAVQSGWMLVENLSTSDAIRVHFNEGGNDNANFKTVKPLHSKPFQVAEGDVLWFSSGVANTRVRVENSAYKPNIDEYFIDEAAVENVPFYVDGVAVTATYDCTTLAKGYATQFQVGCEAAGFTGTIEYSSDNAVTYSSPVTIDSTNPLKVLFQEIDRIVTHIRVTRLGGAYFIYYR